ncbi:MAG TPA: hypothetical protein PKE30_13495 [Niabella sp.]|nr:hypothetical protein [Niabella sp.]
MIFNGIILFIKKRITVINIVFCLLIVLLLMLTLNRSSENLVAVSGKVDFVQNRIVKHNSQTLFKLKNREETFIKTTAVDNRVSFDWFSWINISKGTSVSFYIEQTPNTGTAPQNLVKAVGLSVNGHLKETVKESVINDLYRRNYAWALPVFIVNLAFFFLLIYPRLKKRRTQTANDQKPGNTRAILLILVLILLLWGVPWSLSQYQRSLAPFHSYRIAMSYWKFFLLLVVMFVNFAFGRINEPSDSIIV